MPNLAAGTTGFPPDNLDT